MFPASLLRSCSDIPAAVLQVRDLLRPKKCFLGALWRRRLQQSGCRVPNLMAPRGWDRPQPSPAPGHGCGAHLVLNMAQSQIFGGSGVCFNDLADFWKGEIWEMALRCPCTDVQ